MAIRTGERAGALAGVVVAPIVPAMAKTTDLADLARADGRYEPEAFRLVAAGLQRAAERTGKAEAKDGERHLTAAELVDGIIDLAAERWSYLAGPVMRRFGLRRSRDLGEITFVMITHQVFSKRDEDRIEDFDLPQDDLDRLAQQRVGRRIEERLGMPRPADGA